MACFCRRYFGSNNFDSDDGHRPTIPSTVQHSVRAARRAHPCDLPLCLGAKAFCVSQEGKTMSQGALVKALAEKNANYTRTESGISQCVGKHCNKRSKKQRFRQHSRPLHDQAIREGRRLEGQKSAR